MIDASLGEIMTTCEKITWLLSEGEKWLKPEYRYFLLYFTLLFFFFFFFSQKLLVSNSLFYDEVFELEHTRYCFKRPPFLARCRYCNNLYMFAWIGSYSIVLVLKQILSGFKIKALVHLQF